MPISNSNDTLIALKHALSAEEEPKRKSARTADATKKTKAAKAVKEENAVKEARETKKDDPVGKRKAAKAVRRKENIDNPAEMDTSEPQSPAGKGKKSKAATIARTKAIEKVTAQLKTVEKVPKIRLNGRSSKSGLRISQRDGEVVRKIPVKPYVPIGLGIVDGDSTREGLINAIENGRLSPSEAMVALRKLRDSLVVKVPTGPGGPTSDSIGQIKAYRNIKDGIQNKPLKYLPGTGRSASPVVYQPLRRRLQRSRPRLSSIVGRSLPRKVVDVKTGPITGKGLDIKTVSAEELKLVPVERPQESVPTLSYGLERVLFNPGVYHLQDPRSRVFNFDPYLQTIMPVHEFDFNALKQYITSSRDEALLRIAKEEKKKYTGSTSSMTSALAHFHFLLSQWRPINTGMLSQDFPVEFKTFTALQRGPSAVFLRYKDGTYAIDADKQYDSANILSMLGKSMEKLLTLPTDDFEKYRKENSDQISEEDRNEAEAFNYTTIGDFLLRSQLDAYDPRLPGTGMFDLKTRAVVSIRMDTKAYEEGRGYEIRHRQGEWESYEREYYDMIRSAFLKYSLQVRMGRMDGIFVAFHNTERIFGFQYISLPEMDYALHGTDNTAIGDAEFRLSLELLNRVLDRAIEKYPEKSLRLHFETRGDATPFMYIFAEPMEEQEIEKIQASNRDEILKFEQGVLGLNQKSEEELLEEKRKAEWEVLRAQVEASMEKDELDYQEAKGIAADVLEDSEYWDELSPDEKATAIHELINSSAFNEARDEIRSTGFCGDTQLDNTSEEVEEQDLHGTDSHPEAANDDVSEAAHESGTAESEFEDLDSKFDDSDASGPSNNNHELVENKNLLHDELAEHSDTFIEAGTSENSKTTTDETVLNTTPFVTAESGAEDNKSPVDVFAMTLTIRNLVNGEYVARPTELNDSDKWTIEYNLVDVAGTRSQLIYEACKKRRAKTLSEEKKTNAFNSQYLSKLRKLSQKGRRWRQDQNEIDAAVPVKRLD